MPPKSSRKRKASSSVDASSSSTSSKSKSPSKSSKASSTKSKSKKSKTASTKSKSPAKKTSTKTESSPSPSKSSKTTVNGSPAHSPKGASSDGKTPFQKKVFSAVKSIPSGSTASYKEVGQKIGQPGAAYQIGNALHHCDDKSVPVQRVVTSSGKVAIGGTKGNRGESASQAKRNKKKLNDEGVKTNGDDLA